MAAGQAWIELGRQPADGTGVIWAVRVFPCLQGNGIGTRLMEAAEMVAREKGCSLAEVSVDKESPALRRFYLDRGYAEVEVGPLAALAPAGSPPPEEGSQWVLRKPLNKAMKAGEIRS